MYTAYGIVTLYEWSWWPCSKLEFSSLSTSVLYDHLQSSTCFEQYYAHPQEVRLYAYSIWYRHSL